VTLSSKERDYLVDPERLSKNPIDIGAIRQRRRSRTGHQRNTLQAGKTHAPSGNQIGTDGVILPKPVVAQQELWQMSDESRFRLQGITGNDDGPAQVQRQESFERANDVWSVVDYQQRPVEGIARGAHVLAC